MTAEHVSGTIRRVVIQIKLWLPMESYLSKIFSDLYQDDGMVVIGKGLGLEQLFAKFMILYSSSSSSSPSSSAFPTSTSANSSSFEPKKLVFVLNAGKNAHNLRQSLLYHGFKPEDLPVMINNETPAATRSLLYAAGGCFIITSRVLIIDMLRENIHPMKICGFLIYDSHRVTEGSTESFILSVYREKNRDGFIKAFTDSPEAFGSEDRKVEKILRVLWVKQLYLYPRFHLSISNVLEKGAVTSSSSSTSTSLSSSDTSPPLQPEVIEISQPLTSKMSDVQQAIIVAMGGCLKELKKSMPTLDPSVLSVENAMLKSFDYIMKSQLEGEWHRISPKQKQLMEDVKTLRSLLDNLLRYDAITFYKHLLNLHTTSTQKFNQYNASMWLTTVSAETIFTKSKSRVYIIAKLQSLTTPSSRSQSQPGKVSQSSSIEKALDIQSEIIPTMEVPPKWDLLGSVMQDIRGIINSPEYISSHKNTGTIYDIGRDRVVLVVKDERTLIQVQHYLNLGGDFIADNKFRAFISTQCLSIKEKVVSNRNKTSSSFPSSSSSSKYGKKKGSNVIQAKLLPQHKSNAVNPAYNWMGLGISQEEMKGLSLEQQMILIQELKLYEKVPVVAASNSVNISMVGISDDESDDNDEGDDRDDRDDDKDINVVQPKMKRQKREDINVPADENHYEDDEDSLNKRNEKRTSCKIVLDGLQVIIITSEQIHSAYDFFDDIRPRFVIMYDPDLEIIRRIEVYQARRRMVVPDQVKVFFLMYDKSAEESKYVYSVAKEKKAFERLIDTKAGMVIKLQDFVEDNDESAMFITDTRTVQAAKQTCKDKPVKIVVDLREFRSQLPFLLYKEKLRIVPATITVGDYILSPDICIERKGISDMFQSFNSGRLYNQVEIMLRHYKLSALLIEFNPDKSFCLQGPQDITSDIRLDNICSKLSLLIMKFPALKILWSRGPHTTNHIFRRLKEGRSDPDVDLAMSIGNKSALGVIKTVDDDADIESSERLAKVAASNAAKDMLLSLPGIDAKNYHIVMQKVNSLAQLSKMNEHALIPLIGPLNARSLFEFFHQRISGGGGGGGGGGGVKEQY